MKIDPAQVLRDGFATIFADALEIPSLHLCTQRWKADNTSVKLTLQEVRTEISYDYTTEKVSYVTIASTGFRCEWRDINCMRNALFGDGSAAIKELLTDECKERYQKEHPFSKHAAFPFLKDLEKKTKDRFSGPTVKIIVAPEVVGSLEIIYNRLRDNYSRFAERLALKPAEWPLHWENATPFDTANALLVGPGELADADDLTSCGRSYPDNVAITGFKFSEQEDGSVRVTVGRYIHLAYVRGGLTPRRQEENALTPSQLANNRNATRIAKRMLRNIMKSDTKGDVLYFLSQYMTMQRYIERSGYAPMSKPPRSADA